MNEQNHEIFDQIREWIESGDWKKTESSDFNPHLKVYCVSYTAPWFMDLTDEELEALEEDQDDYFVFHLSIHIREDNSFMIEFDPGMFDLMYKGYDTDADRQAWQDFQNLAREKGLLYEP